MLTNGTPNTGESPVTCANMGMTRQILPVVRMEMHGKINQSMVSAECQKPERLSDMPVPQPTWKRVEVRIGTGDACGIPMMHDPPSAWRHLETRTRDGGGGPVIHLWMVWMIGGPTRLEIGCPKGRAGSSPAPSAFHAPLAQSAEQWSFKPWVVGSSPTGGTGMWLSGKSISMASRGSRVRIPPSPRCGRGTAWRGTRGQGRKAAALPRGGGRVRTFWPHSSVG